MGAASWTTMAWTSQKKPGAAHSLHRDGCSDPRHRSLCCQITFFRSQTALRFRPSVWWGNPWSALSGMAMTLTPGQICAGPNTWPDWLSPTQVLAWYTQWLISSGGFYNTPHGVANAIFTSLCHEIQCPFLQRTICRCGPGFLVQISQK